MTRRMIDSAMWSNENFAALPVMARLLQVGIINHADDQGRIKAHPAYLRSQIFPYDDVAVAEVDGWLDRIAGNGTLVVYEVNGKRYIQLANWWEYQSLQYASPSEHPAPDGWEDRIRYNAKGGMVLTHNWTTAKGETLPDTCDSRGNLPVNPVVHPPETPGDNPPGTSPGTSPGNINKDQIKDQIKDQDQVKERAAHAALADDVLGPKALIEDLRGRRFMYLDPNANLLAAAILDDFSWDRVMAACDIAEKRHREKAKGGQRGIMSPLAYVRTILEGNEQSNGDNNGNNQARGGQADRGDIVELDPELQRRMDEHRAKRKAEGSAFYG